MLRKKNKLPAEVHSIDFELEYGTATIEVHKDSINEKDTVLFFVWCKPSTLEIVCRRALRAIVLVYPKTNVPYLCHQLTTSPNNWTSLHPRYLNRQSSWESTFFDSTSNVRCASVSILLATIRWVHVSHRTSAFFGPPWSLA